MAPRPELELLLEDDELLEEELELLLDDELELLLDDELELLEELELLDDEELEPVPPQAASVVASNSAGTIFILWFIPNVFIESPDGCPD